MNKDPIGGPFHRDSAPRSYFRSSMGWGVDAGISNRLANASSF